MLKENQAAQYIRRRPSKFCTALSPLLRPIFILAHFILNVILTIREFDYRIWLKKDTNDKVTKNDVKIILEQVTQMNKKLRHLVVAADSKRQSMSELARVVVWSLITRVSYVSFHDVTGEVRRNEDKLFLEVERYKKGIPGCIKWSNKPDLNGYSNGIQAHTIRVNILTPRDGRMKIVECVKRITRGEILLQRKSAQIAPTELDEALLLVYSCIPDPEVILYTGVLYSTNGLLPWQIRLSEFIQLSVGHNITLQSYLDALDKYNKRDQRFGK